MIILLALTEKQVVITDNYNPTPISGRQSIFAKVSAPTEARVDVEIVGVYSTLENATLARENHSKEHPGRKYLQKVGKLDEIPGHTPAPPTMCIRCQAVQIPSGSYCPPCHQAYLAECRAQDPMGGAPDPVPVVHTSAGPETRFMHGVPA